MKPIILASTSPRRKELLSQLNLDFQAIPARCEEKMTAGEDPLRTARRLSREKAESLKDKYRSHIIVGADTFVNFKKQVLGKPYSREDAERMLRCLSSQTVTVITGFVILDASRNKSVSRTVTTQVFFKKITPAEIKKYIDSGEPLGKAGAFAIQGKGAVFVKGIKGSYTNILGLPLYKISQEFKKFGINIL